MQRVDEAKLDADVQYRYEYLASFIGFDAEDHARIQAYAPHLGPKIPELVEQTYQKLLEYDSTARHFVPRQHGQEVDVSADLESLHSDHPNIRFRKDHLNRYFIRLISGSYNAKMVDYLDMVGKIHTEQAGNGAIYIPLVQMNALLGLLSELLFEAISASPLQPEAKAATIRSFNKLLWIQNDFVSRHYSRGS